MSGRTSPSGRINNCIDLMLVRSAKAAKALGSFPSDYICALPHSRLKSTFYEHNDGLKTISLSTPTPKFELPYGTTARLLITKLTQFAIEQKSQHIKLPRISQLCKQLGLPVTGARIRHLKNQALSLFGVNFLISADTANIYAGTKFTFIDNWTGWMQATEAGSDWAFDIRLSKIFYQQVTEHAFLVDCRALQALARSMAIDIYLWMIYRLNVIRETVTIGWLHLHQQFGQGYDSNSKFGRYNFKQKFIENFRLARALYPDANVHCDIATGLVLKRSPKHAV